MPSAEQLAYSSLLAASKGDPAALKLISGAIYAQGLWRNVHHNLILRSLQLVLYLAAENADIAQLEELEVPTYAVGREVGKRLGACDVSDPDGAGVRPHIRRGHYHRFWTGPKNGPRELVIRWVEPILVGKKNAGEPDVSIKAVQ